MSNTFLQEGQNFSRWVPPGYGPAVHHSHQPPNLCYCVEPLLFALVDAICCQCKLTFFYFECNTWPSPANKTFGHFNGISRVQQIFPPTLPCFHLVAETRSVSSVFIAQGYQRSNVQNRHPFYHLPYDWQAAREAVGYADAQATAQRDHTQATYLILILVWESGWHQYHAICEFFTC